MLAGDPPSRPLLPKRKPPHTDTHTVYPTATPHTDTHTDTHVAHKHTHAHLTPRWSSRVTDAGWTLAGSLAHRIPRWRPWRHSLTPQLRGSILCPPVTTEVPATDRNLRTPPGSASLSHSTDLSPQRSKKGGRASRGTGDSLAQGTRLALSQAPAGLHPLLLGGSQMP